MKNIFLFGLILASVSTTRAQEISMYKTFGGVRFEKDSTALSTRQVLMLLHDKPTAYDEFKRAKVYDNVSSVLGFTGGALILIPVGTALIGGEPEWRLAAGGAALILASIPLNRIFKARALNALDIYNGKVVSSRIKPEFYFAGTGARLVIRF